MTMFEREYHGDHSDYGSVAASVIDQESEWKKLL